MTNLLIAPEPRGNGGPSLAVSRLLPFLSASGFVTAKSVWSKWDVALVNVMGGKRVFPILASRKPFIYRAAGYYLHEVFSLTHRPWKARYDLTNAIVKVLLSRAYQVVFQSRYAQELLTRIVPDTTDRYAVIYNGIDLQAFRPLSRSRPEIPVIGSVGKLRHERVHGLIRLSQKLSAPHRLLIVGWVNEADRTRLQGYAAQRGLECNIVGPIEPARLVEIYNQIDVFVHLAAGDICPNVVVEALACGVPVVCNSVGGTCELVSRGGITVPGSLYEADDSFIGLAADAVSIILNDLEAYRARARAQAEANLDIRNTAAAYADLLRMAHG